MLDPLADKEGAAIPATDASPRPYAEGLDTPCVTVDLALLERNIAEMATLAYEAGVALRPHVKTHKTPQIAAMQLDAGAVGLTCAKIGEAEVLADAGFTDLFVCFPIVTETKAQRLAALAARPGMTLSTIVDSPQGVAPRCRRLSSARTNPWRRWSRSTQGSVGLASPRAQLRWTSRARSRRRPGCASEAYVRTRGTRTVCQTIKNVRRPRELGSRH
jgi:hypothetical protein